MKYILYVLIFCSFSLHAQELCEGRLRGFIPCVELMKKMKESDFDKSDLSNLEKGIFYEIDGNYKKANEYYMQADTYVAYAEFLVGLNYLRGLGVKQDKNKALEWFTKSANKGFHKSMFNTGALIYYEEMESKYAQAHQFLKDAEKAGNKNVYYLLSKSYLEGLGVDISISSGIELLEKGIKYGDESCAAQLGYFYLTGKYVGENREKGWKLMYEAARLGSPEAKRYIEKRGG